MLSWVRPGLARQAGLAAVMVLACAGPTAFVACGSSGESGGSFVNSDSGTVDTGSSFDGSFDSPSFTDSGGRDGDASEAGPLPTTAVFVQGSPSLPDVRLCWDAVTADPPFPSTGAMPGSNYPGIPLGGSALLDDATPLLGGSGIFAIDAENLARIEQGQTTPYSCHELVCGQGMNQSPPCLRYNLDYWPVSAGSLTLKAGADNVAALAGCLPAALDPSAGTATCGPSWTPLNGNLHADVLQLAGNAGLGGSVSVQVAQLSPALVALVGDAGSAVVSFGAEGSADASVVATLGSEGQISSPALVSIGTNMAAYGQLGFAVDVPGYDGGAGHLWMSLAEAQQLVDPTLDPATFFGQPRPYLVAVLGDPGSPHAFAPGGDAGYDGKGLHVLVTPAASPVKGDP